MLSKFARISQQRLTPETLKIISNTGWLFFSRVFRILVSLVVNTWTARYLGPQQFGVLQYGLAFSSFFMPLSTAQMSPILTRDLVRHPDEAPQILGTGFVLQLIGGIAAGVMSIGTFWLLTPEPSTVHLLVAVIALKFIANSFQPIESWFEAKVASKFVVFANNIAFVVATLLEIFFIVVEASVVAFAAVLVLETAMMAAGLVVFYQRDRQQVLQWRTDLTRLRELFNASLPLLLASTANMLYFNIDRVMLGRMVENSAVGIYSSAATLSGSWYFLPVILASSLYPRIIRARETPATYHRHLQTFYDLVSALAYGLILLFSPLAGVVILLLYGEHYLAASPILTVHLWSSLFLFLGIAQSKWIVVEGLQRFDFVARVTGLICNIGLNLVLIPQYGGMGAAIATLISYAVGGYLVFLVFPQTRANALLMTKALGLPLRLPSLLKQFLSSEV
ncbi:MAG: flippase [Synechococcales bacterium]|nr:flippase [Synechococcales bacterium]